MTHYDYLIIGGGIAGVTAAETIREVNQTASIGIVSQEPHMIYSRVLLPSYLKKRISREQVFLRRAEDFTKKGIDFRLSEEVSKVDTGRREITLTSGLALGYEKLIITSGGRVNPWGVEEEKEFVYRLQTLDDADRLYAALPKIEKPFVVGSSFISLEFLEVFFLNKSPAVLLSQKGRFFSKMLEEKGGEMMRNNFERHNIPSYFEDSIQDIKKKEKELALSTGKFKSFSCDAIAVGVGIIRNIGFLEGSGIRVGEKGILVNEYLETNQPDVFAAGDVAEYNDLILGSQHSVGNWTNAFLQGKRVGYNVAGRKEPFKNVSAYSITNLGFQITALGEFSETAEKIVRIDEAREQYERFFIESGTLRGAVLLNRFADKPYLAKLIETQAPVDDYRAKLTSFEFDINNIPVYTGQ